MTDMKRGLRGAKNRKMSKTSKTIVGEKDVLKGLAKYGYQTEGVVSRAKDVELEGLKKSLIDDDESVESLLSDEEGTEEQRKRKTMKKTKAFQRLRVRGVLGDEYRKEKNKDNRLALSGIKDEVEYQKMEETEEYVRKKIRANDTHSRQGDGDKR